MAYRRRRRYSRVRRRGGYRFKRRMRRRGRTTRPLRIGWRY